MSNGAILDDLGARFNVKPGDDMFPAVKKTIPRLIFILAQVRNH